MDAAKTTATDVTTLRTEAAAAQQSELPTGDWFTCTRWTKYNKDRVYLTLTEKLNGGRGWNGGVGREDWYDVNTGEWHEKTGWAGAKTRNAYSDQYAELQTQIEKAVA